MSSLEPPTPVSRRDFMKAASASIAVAGAVGTHAAAPKRPAALPGPVSVSVQDGRVTVTTSTLVAVLERGHLQSLTSRATGEAFIAPPDASKRQAALRLVYRGNESTPIDDSKFGNIACRQLSDTRAEFVFHAWDGDGVLAVGADPATGDLLVEPSAYSSRPGVRSCRWVLDGIRPDLELVAPLYQGVRLPLEDSLVRGARAPWPITWEAALAILQGRASGCWVHAEDRAFRYKTLAIGTGDDARALGFESEAYGPIDENLSAGGVTWRINVYDGDWTVPAERYRSWLWQAWSLDAREAGRQPWIRDVRLALSWCPTDAALLDALASRVDPRAVLLHVHDWRSDTYDQNYPTYVASDRGRAFLAKARHMGFRAMPHCNSVDMDPSHPVYAQVRDFQYRDLERKTLLGWSWYNERQIGVPDSNAQRNANRDKNVMVKIHPGLSAWRSILGAGVQEAARANALETVFLDVTLTTYNLHNCLVEGMTSTEGMLRLIDHVATLDRGLVVGGEGRNEITAQGLSFAQAHLFESWQENKAGVERTGRCDLNEVLFGHLCRSIGYTALGGQTPAEELRMRLHDEHGAIPTITVANANDILRPNAAVARVLARAAGR